MKEILTEWRRFLNEEEDVGGGLTVGTGGIDFGKVGKDLKDYTVGEYAEFIQKARQDLKDQKESEYVGFIAKTLGEKALTGGMGDLSMGKDAVDVFRKILKNKNDELDQADPETRKAIVDTASDNFILDLLDIDPHLNRKIDNEVLNNLDKEYDKYLLSLDPKLLVGDITDVNDFIRDRIAQDTNRNVVITDENPED
jgi:hypothetical protein